MPYNIFKTGPDDTPFCVHKHDEDGEPIGRALGCHATEAEAKEQMSALYANEKSKVVHSAWTASVAKKSPRHLEVLGVPFGGPLNGKDQDGEFFSKRTDIKLKVGAERPVFYNHGANPDNQDELFPEEIGTAIYTGVREDGHWFDVVVDDSNEKAAMIIASAEKGLARASSGAINYLTRIVKKTGEVLVWTLGELSLIDKDPGKREASNDYAVAHLKTAFEHRGIELPEAFIEAGEAKMDAAEPDTKCKERMSVDPFYLVEARKMLRSK
jgi:hypothetical protein